MTNRKVPCPECGGLMNRYSPRCMACRRRREAAPYRCPDCGGRKSQTTLKRCHACNTIARRNGIVTGMGNPLAPVVKDFEPARLAREIEQGGWTPELLEEWTMRTGSAVAASTIRRWLTGLQRPRTFELSVVGGVLGMEPCPHCHGLGSIPGDPLPVTRFERQQKADSVRRFRQKERSA